RHLPPLPLERRRNAMRAGTRVYTPLRSESKKHSPPPRTEVEQGRRYPPLLSHGLHSPSPLFLSPGRPQG
uniref:Uncharacterized protein n=1 Tax=Aegilops tauschii subsp. strangulata TaxID=200361 RepID=A0A453N726_AEGTS